MNNLMHHDLLVDAVVVAAHHIGAEAFREYPVPPHGFVDVLVVFRKWRVCVEVETTRRAFTDTPPRTLINLSKAATLGASLIILTPTTALARFARQRLEPYLVPWMPTSVLSKPFALRELHRRLGGIGEKGELKDEEKKAEPGRE